MTDNILRIATRKSPLALWQAEEVGRRLTELHPGLQIELVKMSTQGDRILDSPLAKIGGKGLFVKELEAGLLEGRADIAVHSMKDVPVDFPEGLELALMMRREDPRDAFVSNDYARLDDLPADARIGTCSLRRQCQLRERYPQMRMLDLRGNVNTRLAKLDQGDYDAIILASAGLLRLGFGERIRARLSPEQSLPAVGQGVMGIEARSGDARVSSLIEPLRDADAEYRVRAERAFNKRLNGGCQVPIAAYAEIDGQQLRLRGLVGQPDGSSVVRGEISGPLDAGERLGTALAEDLLARGAAPILRELGLHD